MKTTVKFRAATGFAVIVMVLATAAQVVGASSQSVAEDVCLSAQADASGYGRIDSVVRAETADADAIASWQEARLGALIKWVSPLRSIAPREAWTVCLYRGQFVTPTAPSKDGFPALPHDTLRVLVADDGEVLLDSAGYAGRMDPETPHDWLVSGGS